MSMSLKILFSPALHPLQLHNMETWQKPVSAGLKGNVTTEDNNSLGHFSFCSCIKPKGKAGKRADADSMVTVFDGALGWQTDWVACGSEMPQHE